MFIGHFALAYASRRAAPKASLGILFAAAQLADLVWPTLVLLGVEAVVVRPGDTAMTPLAFTHYPYSHSLLGLALLALGLCAGYRAVRGREADARTLGVLAALVLSHWVLDVVSHRPDMPLTFAGDARLGLGLWNSVTATVLVEGLMFAVGVGLYVGSTHAIDRIGRWATWTLVAFLAVVYVANVLGPPPPSAAAVAWSAEAMWLLVAWAAWADRHRGSTEP